MLTESDRAGINNALRKLFPHMAAECYEWSLNAKEEAIYLAGLRAGLERAAKEADHWQQINQSHRCGEYIAAAIRGLAGDKP